jgi:hypothetical protein
MDELAVAANSPSLVLPGPAEGPVAPPPEQKKKGRPPGSKNKPKDPSASAAAGEASETEERPVQLNWQSGSLHFLLIQALTVADKPKMQKSFFEMSSQCSVSLAVWKRRRALVAGTAREFYSKYSELRGNGAPREHTESSDEENPAKTEMMQAISDLKDRLGISHNAQWCAALHTLGRKLAGKKISARQSNIVKVVKVQKNERYDDKVARVLKAPNAKAKQRERLRIVLPLSGSEEWKPRTGKRRGMEEDESEGDEEDEDDDEDDQDDDEEDDDDDDDDQDDDEDDQDDDEDDQDDDDDESDGFRAGSARKMAMKKKRPAFSEDDMPPKKKKKASSKEYSPVRSKKWRAVDEDSPRKMQKSKARSADASRLSAKLLKRAKSEVLALNGSLTERLDAKFGAMNSMGKEQKRQGDKIEHLGDQIEQMKAMLAALINKLN